MTDRKRSKVLSLGLSCLTLLWTATGWSDEAPAAAKKTETLKVEESLLFNVKAGKRWVLGRSDALGACKGYLSADGMSWQSFPDPEVPGDDLAAATSADGSTLALLSSRGGAVNVWVMDTLSHKLEAITEDDGGIIEPSKVNSQVLAFSPDGKRLAYIQRGEVTVTVLATRTSYTLTQGGNARSFTWSPDGNWLAVVQGQSVHKIGTAGAPDLLLVSDQCEEPKIFFNGNEDIYFLGSGIRKISGQKPAELVLASRQRPNDMALLTGKNEIAFFEPSSAGRSEIFIFSPGVKTGATKQVTQGGAEAVWSSSTGKNLFFKRAGRIWRCDLDGVGLRKISSVRTGFVGIGALAPLKGVCQ